MGDGFIIIAHRGASAVAPESTRAAIRTAVAAGAQMIELDVQMTRDGRLVIFHDDRVERTTDGAGRLTAMRYAQVARLNAGVWRGPQFAGERILLVSQALRLIPSRVRVNLELKRTANRQALLQHFLPLAQRHWKRLLISSFDHQLLAPLQRTHLARALICHERPDRSLRDAVRLGCQAWHPLERLVTPQRVAWAHAAGLRVHPWTVDDPTRARQLVRWGVDGVFTNDPARLRRARSFR